MHRRGGSIGPDDCLHTEYLLRDFCRQVSQPGDDFILRRGNGEKGSSRFPRFEVQGGHIDAVSLPQLRDGALQKEGEARLPCRFRRGLVPRGQQRHFRAGQRHQARRQETREYRNGLLDVFLGEGNERRDGDPAGILGGGSGQGERRERKNRSRAGQAGPPDFFPRPCPHTGESIRRPPGRQMKTSIVRRGPAPVSPGSLRTLRWT